MQEADLSPESALILRYIEAIKSVQHQGQSRPTFALDDLAGLLGLGREPCKRALYALYEQGRIELTLRQDGRFELWTTSAAPDHGPVEPAQDSPAV